MTIDSVGSCPDFRGASTSAKILCKRSIFLATNGARSARWLLRTNLDFCAAAAGKGNGPDGPPASGILG